MLSSVKDVLNKEVDIKGILTKEVNVKEFLEMEIELTKLKELLATEIKLKEFLVQEIDLNNLLVKNSDVEQPHNRRFDDTGEEVSSTVDGNDEQVKAEEKLSEEPQAVKKQLPVFDYTLIETLHEENMQNRFVFNELMRFAVEKDYKKVAGRLEVFNSQIREHYQKADVQLYAYLKTYIQLKFPKREKAFTQLSLEMKNISIEIFYGINQSPNIPLTEKTHEGFMKEFMHLGKLLNERIHREESVLYKMYEQTHQAKSIS